MSSDKYMVDGPKRHSIDVGVKMLGVLITFILTMVTAWNRDAASMAISAVAWVLFTVATIEHITDDYFRMGQEDAEGKK